MVAGLPTVSTAVPVAGHVAAVPTADQLDQRAAAHAGGALVTVRFVIVCVKTAPPEPPVNPHRAVRRPIPSQPTRETFVAPADLLPSAVSVA